MLFFLNVCNTSILYLLIINLTLKGLRIARVYHVLHIIFSDGMIMILLLLFLNPFASLTTQKHVAIISQERVITDGRRWYYLHLHISHSLISSSF